MPVIGSFHDKFWKARANAAPVAGTSSPGMYPAWQASVVVGMFAIWESLAPLWNQLRWSWRLVVRLWHWRAPASRARLEAWIARLEECDREELLVLDRVVTVIQQPSWTDARQRVRACATTPKFHQPDQWVAYSRAIKADGGQAQNVFRHLKVVQELKATYPTLSNPDAHLLAELAYQGLALTPARPRVLVQHPVLH